MRERYGKCWSGLVVVVTLLLAPSSASAAAQIGETFLPDPMISGECSEGFVRLQGTSPGGQYAAPFDGVITAWTIEAGPTPAPVRFKAAHPEGGNSFTIVGESDQKTLAPSQLNVFTDIRIPVQAGDVIGVYLAETEACFRAVPGGGYQENPRFGDVTPGATASFDADVPNENQLNLAAVVEADCDADGFGDETQDPSHPCPRSVALDANKNKVKKGKKVTLSGQIAADPQTSPGCGANQTVELQRKKPKQTEFTTLEQLQTDAAGAFSAKEKVKKTFEYRVQAAETATCGSADSNTEKVKAKKPK
jgi:hypothetical protein